MKLTVKMAPDVTETVWLQEAWSNRFVMSVSAAVLMSCPCAGFMFSVRPELEFESQDGVLLISCEAIGLEEKLELEGRTRRNGDLRLKIHDKSFGIVIRMTIPDAGYSQICSPM